MPREFTDLELLTELEPVAAENVNRHFAATVDWHPHDYVPWDRGRNFAAMGGDDWAPEQSQLSEVAKAAMITNLLTEDNLPSYHRQAAEHFSLDGAWGTWVGRWTAEESRHSIVMRDYLVVTRGVDPVALEQARMAHMTNGFRPTAEEEARHKTDFLLSIAYVSFQELATRVSHRNTGKVVRRPDRRPDASAHRRRREPAHDLLPEHVRGGPGPRPGPGAGGGRRRRRELPDARAGHAQLPPQRRADGQARHLRPAPAPRRGSDTRRCASGASSNARTSAPPASSVANNSPTTSSASKARCSSSRNSATGCWPAKPRSRNCGHPKGRRLADRIRQ